jgi:hypothetical protein
MKFLAAAVFFPMLWLRGLVIVLGRALSTLLSLGGVIAAGLSLLTRHHYWLIAGMLCASGFLAFLGMQLYDSILVRLNPTQRTFLFYQ